MFKSIKPVWIAAVCALTAGLTAPVSARNSDTITYTVVPGDSLYSIAQRYLVSTRSTGQLQRINGVRNPRRLRIDRTLTIPRQLLRYETVELTVYSFSGPVEIGGGAPVQNMVLREGQTVTTGRNGFVSFSGTFGGRITLPSNTTARLITARRYALGDTLDVDFAVTRGRANTRSPTLNGQDRLRMRTPVAVTAVRGTEFRVAYDPDNADVSLTEVTEGNVQVAAGDETRPAPAGFGVSSSPSGVSEPEALLPPPGLIEPTAVQTAETLNFAFEPVEGAQGYRVQIAQDASLLEVVSEQIVDTETAAFTGLENGRYYVAARSIAQSGLEGGNTGSASFLRKLVGVTAGAGSSPDFDGFNFRWAPEGGENATFAFQLWSQDAPDVLLVDEVGLTGTQITLTNLANGKYDWRVAASETDPEEGLIKVWAPVQTVTVAD